MERCVECGAELSSGTNYCGQCGAEITDFPEPAGFWVRVGAYLVDLLVFIPVIAIGVINTLSWKSTVLMLVLALPWLLYKPVMEARYGATLGKMAVGVKVVNEFGREISLGQAYARFAPFLASAVLGTVTNLMLFTSPEFQSATHLEDIGRLQQGGGTCMQQLLGLVVLIDCVVAAFSHRKRAVHDMIAGTYCVYR